MRAIVQRVTRARVTVDDLAVGEIANGFCIFLAVGPGDSEEITSRFAGRIATLRICTDTNGKMNRDLIETGGEALVVSQFTLYADATRGHRPSFTGAGAPAHAAHLCDTFVAALAGLGVRVAGGRFAAHMQVELVNDGPVTMALTSGEAGWVADAG